MLTAIVAFLLGVFFSPVIKPMLRPLFVEVIKLGLMTADEVRKMSSKVKEDLEDAAAEATADRAKAQPKAEPPTTPGANAERAPGAPID
jgi:hypothetical protein